MKFAVENGNLRKQMERMSLIKNFKGTIQEKSLKKNNYFIKERI